MSSRRFGSCFLCFCPTVHVEFAVRLGAGCAQNLQSDPGRVVTAFDESTGRCSISTQYFLGQACCFYRGSEFALRP
ncbi:hypothetical protein BU26DRAFT_282284 [Trematosphaeria pertusa]|uniref:Secreted protein n=1 Tax=Trematosphaeria pertusa TaxID=390896 RepID=A0A6A6ILX0_9PLEO|nr:uncharacterized protein BU26DRAFT_282284 [Trematosphaeria pertusa]KAF2251406.1 hypothetical protein BU26DRAFT_282284 [Trematosphaeria pertusa]